MVCVIDMSRRLVRLQEAKGFGPTTWRLTETDGPEDECVLNHARVCVCVQCTLERDIRTNVC